MAEATQGDTVKVHYTGKTPEGEVFDTSRERDPLEFKIGAGQVIPGFENAVRGMHPGEKKTETISVDQAYGQYREDLILEIDRKDLPPNVDPNVGEQLEMVNDRGDRLIVTVKDTKDDSISIDANHPLAGRDLVFDLELVEIKPRIH
ncbi:MAG: peptidylprolyl isomerase [Candidatus Kapaibacterium sp.]